MRRTRHLSVPHPARRDRSEPSTSPCRSRLATPRPPFGLRWDVRRECPSSVPHPAIAASEHSPVPLVRLDLTPPAAGCAPGGATMPWFRCYATAASRVRPRPSRAARPPLPACKGLLSKCAQHPANSPCALARMPLRVRCARHLPHPCQGGRLQFGRAAPTLRFVPCRLSYDDRRQQPQPSTASPADSAMTA